MFRGFLMKKAIVACLLLHSIFVMSEKTDVFKIEFNKECAGLNFNNGYLALTTHYKASVRKREFVGLPQVFESNNEESLRNFFSKKLQKFMHEKQQCRNIGDKVFLEVKSENELWACSQNPENLKKVIYELIEQEEKRLKLFGQMIKDPIIHMFTDNNSVVMNQKQEVKPQECFLMPSDSKAMHVQIDAGSEISDEMLGAIGLKLLESDRTVEYHGMHFSIKMTVVTKEEHGKIIDMSELFVKRPGRS